MPLPDPADPNRSTWRLLIQVGVALLYTTCAAMLMFYAWHIAKNSVQVARTTEAAERLIVQQSEILDKQTAILTEIKNARSSIPSEVKNAVKNSFGAKP